MKLKEIISQLGLQVIHLPVNADIDVKGGFTSDLLSHVVGNAQAGSLWLTCQMHRNVIAVASLKDLAGIVIVDFEGRLDDDLLQMAKQENVPVLTSEINGFELSGELFNLLFPKRDED